MKLLFEIDYKNYTGSEVLDRREAARAIIYKGDKLVMVHSKLYDCYIFPGGGIKKDESKLEALYREVMEETGLLIDTNSVKEFGMIKEYSFSKKVDNSIFEHTSYFYQVNLSDETMVGQRLDPNEQSEEYEVVFISPLDALKKNTLIKDNRKSQRATKILELLVNA